MKISSQIVFKYLVIPVNNNTCIENLYFYCVPNCHIWLWIWIAEQGLIMFVYIHASLCTLYTCGHVGISAVSWDRDMKRERHEGKIHEKRRTLWWSLHFQMLPPFHHISPPCHTCVLTHTCLCLHQSPTYTGRGLFLCPSYITVSASTLFSSPTPLPPVFIVRLCSCHAQCFHLKSISLHHTSARLGKIAK